MRSIKRTEYIYHIKSLLLLGLPIIIGQLGNIITGLADTVMVGQHSTEELAAASFVNKCNKCIYHIRHRLFFQLHTHNW